MLTIHIPADKEEQMITVESVKSITVNYVIVIASFILLFFGVIVSMTTSMPFPVYIAMFILGNIGILAGTIRQKVSEVRWCGLTRPRGKIAAGSFYLLMVLITAISSFIAINGIMCIFFTFFQAIGYAWYLKMF